MLKRKDIPVYKKELFKKQNGLCSLTGLKIEDINKAHLDHDHALTGPNAGRCRGLLLGNANVLEGRIKHQFKRSGLDGRIDYIKFLKNLVNYLEKDYSDRPVHPQMNVDLIKQFSRMNLQPMREKLSESHLDASGDKKTLIKRYKNYLRQENGKNKELCKEC